MRRSYHSYSTGEQESSPRHPSGSAELSGSSELSSSSNSAHRSCKIAGEQEASGDRPQQSNPQVHQTIIFLSALKMGKFYCDYCDAFLTHDSVGVHLVCTHRRVGV